MNFQLLFYAKDYPNGEQYFKKQVYQAFSKHKSETNSERIEQLLQQADYVAKEVEALIKLKVHCTSTHI